MGLREHTDRSEASKMKVCSELVFLATLLVCCVRVIQPMVFGLHDLKSPSRHQRGRAVYAEKNVNAKNTGKGIRAKISSTALKAMYAKLAAFSRNALRAKAFLKMPLR